MFEVSNQIYRIDSKSSFMDLREAFAIGKIHFQLIKYNDKAEKGKKITNSADFFMDINDAAYFAELCKSGRLVNKIRTLIKMNKPGLAIHKYAGKKVKDNEYISRQFRVEGNDENKYFFKIILMPGSVTSTGAILPQKNGKIIEQVVLRVTADQIGELGTAIERAVTIYDLWVSMGTLERNLERIRYRKEDVPAFSEGIKKDIEF